MGTIVWTIVSILAGVLVISLVSCSLTVTPDGTRRYQLDPSAAAPVILKAMEIRAEK